MCHPERVVMNTEIQCGFEICGLLAKWEWPLYPTNSKPAPGCIPSTTDHVGQRMKKEEGRGSCSAFSAVRDRLGIHH